jgi:hypothetical protein
MRRIGDGNTPTGARAMREKPDLLRQENADTITSWSRASPITGVLHQGPRGAGATPVMTSSAQNYRDLAHRTRKLVHLAILPELHGARSRTCSPVITSECSHEHHF